MKKLLSVITCLLGAAILAGAQDIIIKTDGSEIQAKVLEVSETSVRYRIWPGESGPVRVLDTGSIFKITYSDGGSEVFTTPEKAIANVQRNQAQASAGYGDPTYETWTRSGSNITAGAKVLNEAQLKHILSTAEYDNYTSGHNMKYWGEYLWGFGLGWNLGELISQAIWGVSESDIIFYSIGTTMILIGIPLDIAGTAKLNKVVENHNGSLVAWKVEPALLPANLAMASTAGPAFVPGISLKLNF